MPSPDNPRFIRPQTPDMVGSIVIRNTSTEGAYIHSQPDRRRVLFATQDEELLAVRVDFSSDGTTSKTADLRNLFSIRDGVDLEKVARLLKAKGVEPILPENSPPPVENEAEALQDAPISVGKLDTDTGVGNHHRNLLKGNFERQPRRSHVKAERRTEEEM